VNRCGEVVFETESSFEVIITTAAMSTAAENPNFTANATIPLRGLFTTTSEK